MAVRESGENGVKHAATHIQIHIYVMGTHTLARLLLQNVDIGKRLWRDEGEGWECGGHHWRLLLLWCLVRFMVKCMRISWRLQWRSGSVPHMITTIEALRVDRTQPAIRFYSVPEMLWQLQMSEQKLWLQSKALCVDDNSTHFSKRILIDIHWHHSMHRTVFVQVILYETHILIISSTWTDEDILLKSYRTNFRHKNRNRRFENMSLFIS